MGTAILRSHDCLRSHLSPDTFRPTFPPKQTRNASPNATRNGRRNRRCKDNVACNQTVVRVPSANLVMEKVTILKRGDVFKPYSPSKDNRCDDENRTNGVCSSDDEKPKMKIKVDNDDVSILSSTDRLGPDPELVPKQIRLTDLSSGSTVYAGSGFSSSPSPSSLPFPGFFSRKETVTGINDMATKDLCRMLRLDLI